VMLIDCGGYQPCGRLVSDLALIERDIKLVLMGTEQEAKPFFDVDVRRLKEWCAAEKAACEERLDFSGRAAGQVKISESTKRAYRLVGVVRRRAKEVSKGFDDEGLHYFAALLYWTLDVLKERPVRRTKKLLALYSASEILDRFK